MTELTLESLAEPVRDFLRSLPTDNGETVVVAGGRAVFRIRPAADTAAGWADERNARRFELIDRDLDGTLSPVEAAELESLQVEFRRHRRRVAPLPLGETQRVLAELERKAADATA
jgi:hypothetical protein